MERAIDSIRDKMRKLKEQSKLINHIYGAEVALGVVERWLHFHSTSFCIPPLSELDDKLDNELDDELDDETSPLFSIDFSAMRADPSASAWRSSACGKASDDRDFDVDVVASSTRSTRSRSRYKERYQDMAQ